VNTHAEYRRHSYRPEPQIPAADAEQAINQLAHHRDPSLATAGTSQQFPSKRIAWVRPTELANLATPIVGRGIDLQAELIRRARRTPATTTRAVRRSIHSTTPRPTQVTQEGVQL
jgi:hypothetical protein